MDIKVYIDKNDICFSINLYRDKREYWYHFYYDCTYRCIKYFRFRELNFANWI